MGGELGHEDGGEAETDNDVMREATGMEAMSEESSAGGMSAVAVEEVEVEVEEEGREAKKHMEVNEDDKKGGRGEDGGKADGGGAQGPLQSTSGGLDAKVGAVHNGEHAAAAGHDAHGRIYVGLGMGLAGACEMSDDDEQGGGDREVAGGDVREGGGEAMRDAGGECRRGTEGTGEGKTPNDREEVVTEDGGEGLGDGAGKVSVEEESGTPKRLETGCMVSTESREEETDAGETGDVDAVQQQDADEGRGGTGGEKVQGNGRGEGDDCEGGGSGRDSDFELKPEEEDDDDHNYEITDFSLATPWERFVRDCEGVLLRWGLGGGGLGSGWDTPEGKASREHTILNSSETKGVKNRCAEVLLQGRRFVLRHVVWLPEGSKEWGERNGGGGIGGLYAGVCGIEALLNKRSSAATSTNYVHELGYVPKHTLFWKDFRTMCVFVCVCV